MLLENKMDINDIFASKLSNLKVSQTLKFEEPVFENPIQNNPAMPKETPVVPEGSKNTIEEPVAQVVKPVSSEDAIDGPKSFSETISSEIESQQICMRQAFNEIMVLQVQQPSLDLAFIKDCIEKAMSSSRIIKSRAQGVVVL